MNGKPIYTSGCALKNIWQKYHIFADRLEFDTHFGTMTVPFANIEKAVKSESDLKGLLRGNLNLKDFRPALKLDFANFTEHITIDKSDGKVHRILFSPENIDEFFNELTNAINKFNSKQSG